MTPDLRRLCEAAAVEGRNLDIDYEGGYSASDNPADWEAIVRAVLTALREPSRATIDAARVYVEGEYPQEWPVMPAQRKEVLTAMIDHILAEPATA